MPKHGKSLSVANSTLITHSPQRASKRRRITSESDGEEDISGTVACKNQVCSGERDFLAVEGQKLKSFEQRDDSLRSIVTCKICFRMLYEPYTLGCGHTYCYSCLCSCFDNTTKRRKTCPECRTAVLKPPAPAYALREIVREMVNKAELLPQDETMEEHEQLKKEEADIVEMDRLNHHPQTGGLFKGRFLLASVVTIPIWDEEDHVLRCPLCTNELEDEYECEHCPWSADGGDADDTDLDGSLQSHSENGHSDGEDGGGHVGPPNVYGGNRLWEGVDPWSPWLGTINDTGPGSEDEEEYDDEDEDDFSLDGFLVDDGDDAESGSESESEGSVSTIGPPGHASTFTTAAEVMARNTGIRPRRYVVSDSDDGESSDSVHSINGGGPGNLVGIDSSTDDEAGNQVSSRRGRIFQAGSDSGSESESEDGVVSRVSSLSSRTASTRPRTARRRPVIIDLTSEEETGTAEDDEDSDESELEAHPRPRPTVHRPRSRGNQVQRRAHATATLNQRRALRGLSHVSISSGASSDSSY